ncbi:MAG: hydrogenase maturation protease [Anaerolineae bacterium]|nr:hydrogenase maturation protease [Anaerolineae bacterium]
MARGVSFMIPVLIIGYGNTLRGDDGIGVAAAEEIRAGNPDVDVITCHQLAPELAEPISQARLVIFVDASAATAPGTIVAQRITSADLSHSSFTHHVDPATLLALAGTLFGGNPEAWLMTVGIASTALGAPVSPLVAAALPELQKRIDSLIDCCA